MITHTTEELLYEILLNVKFQSSCLSKQLNNKHIEISTRGFTWQYDKGTNDRMTFTNCPQYPSIDQIYLSSDQGVRLASSFTQDGNNFTVKCQAGFVAEGSNYRLDILHAPYSPEPANIKPDITGVKVTSYNGVYDGNTHAIVDITGMIEGDTVSCGPDLDHMEIGIPVIKNAGNMDGYCKITREGYNDLITEIHAVISLLDIKGISITNTYGNTYDGQEHPAFEISGTEEGDIISTSIDQITWSPGIPTLKHVYTENIYVKISRNNYNDLILGIFRVFVMPRDCYVAGNSYSVVYDGNFHGGNGSTLDNLVEGDTFYSETIDGGGTEVGVYNLYHFPGSLVIHDSKGNNVTPSYHIVIQGNGTVTITAE